ncbi:phosphatase 2C-like domain-containing protein [Halteromyces radiatus]|uniref:phosphatase 2C-like domain-containing protein n=1 Tax=Halteromyces radiatus TaxID=101107 RepID=UPI002220FC72|nr:phosphatase 2C-like domain-containing protein [Halteromyces radiatus]KAI8089730.1 phosphatase 2C-like domain-containing protein [Halteromyces radiatus]
MPVPIRTISTVAVSLGLSGATYYIYQNQPRKQNDTFDNNIQEQPYNDSRPFKWLTPEEINTRLRAKQFANKVNLNHVRAVYTSQLASNNPVEDHYSTYLIGNNGLYAGVYDGHIGPLCSKLIRKQLPSYVARQLETKTEKETVEEAISTAFVDLDQDIQQRFYDLFPRNVQRLTEKDVQDAVRKHANPAAADLIIKEAIHGSCACAIYLDGDDLYAANTGDSRVVIVRQEEDGTWSGRRLVEEESPANPAWREHMISQHPPDEAEDIIKRNRIFGLIAVGGSFGDIMYKVPRDYQIKVLPFIPYEAYSTFARYHHRIVVNYRTPPYLSSKPLTSHHKLQKGDKYIIIGTDGLWDELSWDNVRSEDGDQVAAQLISIWDSAKNSKEANPATHMIRESLLYDAVYKNIGVRVPVTDETLEMSKRLTRQPSRRYRDDITVTVIELKDQNDHTEASLQDVGPVTSVEQIEIEPRLVIPKKSNWYSGWLWSRL